MPITPFDALACPLDGNLLTCSGNSWRCPSGHTYDISAQGYTHLLPVQNKRSKDPGDSREMVAARRRYLEAGPYQVIADAVARAVLAELPIRGATCLDAGCGEGYYLRQLANAAGETHALAVLGLDISKWAVLAAAKADRRMGWVVGSNANLPVLPVSVDRLLCMFGFPVYGEFARVLRPGGRLIQVDPGPDHLRELREIIYPILKPARTLEPSVPAGFALLGAESLRYGIALEAPEQIADLLVMTPHLYKASPEGRARAAGLTRLALTVEVRLSVLERLPTAT
ncbi:MAG: methyltransferase domain-containing protein [Zoogloea sp.]|nr:methyltransferase domain-containing protein [Zoogloea sp.]MDD3353702.1 methyltransferase domain-containing protein [Zoogloea sp.]